MSAEAYVLLWGGMVLFWLCGVFVTARDIWRTRTGVRIGRLRFTARLLLTLLLGPLGLFGALMVVEPVLPFQGVGWWIYCTTMLLAAVVQFFLLIISGGRLRFCGEPEGGD